MENDRGYFIYKDKNGVKTVDHPKLVAILSHLKLEFNDYKYTIYRCASKIVALQEVLYTYHIPFKLVLSVLEKHNFIQADSTPIFPSQLTAIIHDIFFASEKLNYFSQFSSFNIEIATEVLANFLWNIFDPQRQNPILLVEFKETFLVFCEVNSLDELISQFFNLVADYNRCVSRFRLEIFLKILSKILSFIGEEHSYGSQNIPSVIEQCFAQCPGMNGISEYHFNCLWTTTDTRFLIYGNLLALVKRIKSTKKLVHNNKCASCATEKILGIRFKCQICHNLSLCLKCFSIGFENGKHCSSHRMNEVFSEDNRTKKWTHYVAKLCNIFFTSRGSENVEPVDDRTYEENIEMIPSDASIENNNKNNGSIKSNSLREHNLNTTAVTFQTIINSLKKEREKIEKQKQIYEKRNIEDERISHFLNEHKQALSNIIDQLYCIMENSKIIIYPLSSTPNRTNNNTKEPTTLCSILSRSINGAEINKTYLDANKADYSVSDLSTWFHQRRQSTQKRQPLHILEECNDDDDEGRDTKMDNFRELLTKVKEIVDDSYSDNVQLAEATSHLEAFLDSIIFEEETKRKQQ